mmetsp:Transcript_29035/g.70829  ORF Transcript_29035/g.70829 Transcript_29035/m.70829 type:complete len:138 (-) Transcript_29035:385-798(-)|eukprot:CAMPEP_0114525656 /NCGR_PEP_ID=MMETSP0109-20121206/22554_1 /TAXON_ID=29199 /ORGANISM="Chlorarachnion reptans, Strain CCCM449" /LENGTH=137 /DNA_ID=CAMNT_0001707279 /DNA_START=9 /DNA_END=422 /DNA_ORIENTATION=-
MSLVGRVLAGPSDDGWMLNFVDTDGIRTWADLRMEEDEDKAGKTWTLNFGEHLDEKAIQISIMGKTIYARTWLKGSVNTGNQSLEASFPLPKDVDKDLVSADAGKGLLTISLPRKDSTPKGTRLITTNVEKALAMAF